MRLADQVAAVRGEEPPHPAIQAHGQMAADVFVSQEAALPAEEKGLHPPAGAQEMEGSGFARANGGGAGQELSSHGRTIGERPGGGKTQLPSGAEKS